MRKPQCIFVVVSLAALGCTDAAEDPGGEDAPPVEAYELTWGPVTVPPGTEDTRCVVMRLGNDVPVALREIENTLGGLSHHYIVYTTTETEERREPFPCASLDNLLAPEGTVPLMITQKASDVLTLPDGVGFVLEPDQMLRLELHYINATDAPVDVQVATTLRPMAMSELTDAAGFLFIGNPDIELPPGQEASLGPSFLPLPGELNGSRYFGITGHQHQWGTDVFVETAATADGPGTPVYDVDGFSWSEPETVYHDPPFQIEDYGGFRFTCTWNNQSDRTVRFGEDVNDEMCFFWAYYYPSKGARTCFHTERSGGPLDVCCPGGQLCGLIYDNL